VHRAEQAITEMADDGEPVTVALIAKRAGVSRSWIYTQPTLRDRIDQLRQHRTAATATRNTATRASDDSLRHRLALAHERISQLRTENQQLRDALAHAHGQLREARLSTNGQRDPVNAPRAGTASSAATSVEAHLAVLPQ
jgi:chromosome segregation ATPase